MIVQPQIYEKNVKNTKKQERNFKKYLLGNNGITYKDMVNHTYQPLSHFVKYIRETYHIEVAPITIKRIFEKYGLTAKKRYNALTFNNANAMRVIASHIDDIRNEKIMDEKGKNISSKMEKEFNSKPVTKPRLNYDNPMRKGISNASWENLEKDGVFGFTDESVLKATRKALNELELFHGSSADFDKFDLAYLSKGWGSQVYGYGIYLTTSQSCAKEYSRGGYIYQVKVPNKGYIHLGKITRRQSSLIANAAYEYILSNDAENQYNDKSAKESLWKQEVSAIAQASTGNDLYGTLAVLLGGDKETSEFLYKIGYRGLKWAETDSYSGKQFMNYVVFNPKSIKILKKKRIEDDSILQ